MRHSDFTVLLDPETGYLCHQTPVRAGADELVEPVRQMFVDSMESFGYVGFSHAIDETFHRRSTYNYVTAPDGRVVMTCRITPREPGTIVPFEMGLREDGSSYRLDGDSRVVDINTYTYVPGHYEIAMPLLVAGLGQFAKEWGAAEAYCLYDMANDRIKRAYLSVRFVLSSRFPEPVHFPTFGRRVDCHLEPTRWRVMEWSADTIEAHAVSATERYRAGRPEA
ncbi:MAG TPA: hypothetical protein VHU81_13190 [Thermoanaerobaculia bacterium]|jgi:hypothetical protein|nr:hypothetical protein [Thermoanaerobaculia bacterium]